MSNDPCIICGKTPSDRAHIKTKATGGTWDEENIMHLCRFHHQSQHKLGWYTFAEHHLKVRIALCDKGWEFFEEFGIPKLRRIE